MATVTTPVRPSTTHGFVYHRVYTKKYMASPEQPETEWQPDRALTCVQVNRELGGTYGQATLQRKIGRYREPGAPAVLDDEGRIPPVVTQDMLDRFVRVVGFEKDAQGITRPRLLFEGVITDETEDDTKNHSVLRAMDYRYVLDEVWCLRAWYHNETWFQDNGNADPPEIGRMPSFNIRRQDGKLVGNRSHDGFVEQVISGTYLYFAELDRTYLFNAETPPERAVSIFAGANATFSVTTPQPATYTAKPWSAYDVLRYLFNMHIPHYTLIPYSLIIPTELRKPLETLFLEWSFQGKRLRQCLTEIFASLGLSYTVTPILGGSDEVQDITEVRVSPVSLTAADVHIENPEYPGDPEKDIVIPGNTDEYVVPDDDRTINVIWTRSSLRAFDGVLSQGQRIKVSMSTVRRNPSVEGSEESLLAKGFTDENEQDFLNAPASGTDSYDRNKYKDVYAVYVIDPDTLVVAGPNPALDNLRQNVPIFIARDRGPDWDEDGQLAETGAGIHRTQHLLPGDRPAVVSGIRGFIDYEPRAGVPGVPDDTTDEDTEASSNADEGDADSAPVAGPAIPFLLIRKAQDVWIVEQQRKALLHPNKIGFRMESTASDRLANGQTFIDAYAATLAFECDDYLESWIGLNEYDSLKAPDTNPLSPDRRRGWSRISLVRLSSALYHYASKLWPPVYDCVEGERKSVYGQFRSDWDRLAMAARFEYARRNLGRSAQGVAGLIMTDLWPGAMLKKAGKTSGQPIATVSFDMIKNTTVFKTGSASIGK